MSLRKPGKAFFAKMGIFAGTRSICPNRLTDRVRPTQIIRPSERVLREPEELAVREEPGEPKYRRRGREQGQRRRHSQRHRQPAERSRWQPAEHSRWRRERSKS